MFKFEKVSRFEGVDIPAPTRKTNKSAGYDMVVAEDVVIYPMQHLTQILGNILFSQRVTPELEKVVQKMSETNVETAQSVLDTALTCTTDELAEITKSTGLKPTLVSTGYKAYMDDGYSLDLYIRSSSPLKYWLVLANSTGIIDGDYVDNPDNEGEIFFQVINLSPVPIKLRKGEIIGQAKFVAFSVTEDDADQEKADRAGGFGSTSEVEVEIVEEVPEGEINLAEALSE